MVKFPTDISELCLVSVTQLEKVDFKILPHSLPSRKRRRPLLDLGGALSESTTLVCSSRRRERSRHLGGPGPPPQPLRSRAASLPSHILHASLHACSFGGVASHLARLSLRTAPLLLETSRFLMSQEGRGSTSQGSQRAARPLKHGHDSRCCGRHVPTPPCASSTSALDSHGILPLSVSPALEVFMSPSLIPKTQIPLRARLGLFLLTFAPLWLHDQLPGLQLTLQYR